MVETPPELLAFLKEEESRSQDATLLLNAETALKSYNGELYGDEEEGRSQVVSRDVAEVVDQMQISVLRVFVSGDRVVEFEPNDPEGVQAADDATEAIQRQFQRKGYGLLHDWFKEGNLSTIGVVKTCVERKRKRVEGLIPLAMLDELGAIEADDQPEMGEDGVERVNAVVLQEGPPEFKDYLVPLEEFGINPEARDIDDAIYIRHATWKTLSELTEMGFDDVEDLQSGVTADETGLGFARDNNSLEMNSHTGALRRVVLLEEYARFDLDGDGLAERLRVHRVGTDILKIEPVEYQPFVVYCPFPMPGRFGGHSLADKVIDLQRINSILNRLGLDGLYRNLATGYIVPDPAVNENTYDDLLTVRPNRIIRTTGAADIKPEPANDVSTIAFNAMEFMIGQREARTGITRLNQGLDADALNKTATGTAMMQAQGQQMEEYLARNFAEALSRLMRLKYQLMRAYGQPFTIRVDGEFRQVDPSTWPEDVELVTRVGLGSGRKEQRLANRMMLLQIQREVMMGGLPIVGPEQIYKSIQGLVKDASLGSPNDYVLDPSQLEPQEPQPDPEQMKLEAEMQIQAAKVEGDQQIQGMKLEAMREEAALKAQLARDEAAAAAELAREKAAAEFDLAQQKFAIEVQMEERRMEMEDRRMEREAQRRERETDVKLSQNRKGGDLDK